MPTSRWFPTTIGAIVEKGWDKVVDAIGDVISTPEVDSAASAKAEAELEEPPPEEEEETGDGATAEEEEVTAAADTATEQDEQAASPQDNVVLGADEDFWAKVGIDPIRMMTSSGTFFTLRCCCIFQLPAGFL